MHILSANKNSEISYNAHLRVTNNIKDKTPRWNLIADRFENLTKDEKPNLTVSIKKAINDNYCIDVIEGKSSCLFLTTIVPKTFGKLMQLTDEKLVEKLRLIMNLPEIYKKHDNYNEAKEEIQKTLNTDEFFKNENISWF